MTEKEPSKRVESAFRAVSNRINNQRDADITIKIRDGAIVEYTDTEIIRFK